MPSKTDEKANRTQLRIQLLKNGYVPLPNRYKRPAIPGWQKVQPDEEMIRSWERFHGAETTGLRLDNGLIAFDFDIDDLDAYGLFDDLADEFPATDDAFMRTGGGYKAAFFLRCDEPFNRIATPVFKGRCDGEKGAMLEVFGGASARQFGAYGPHSAGVEYKWCLTPDDSTYDPATVPLADLPVVPKSLVFEIVDFTTRWLEEQGFELLTEAGAGEAVSVHEYVLTEDLHFDVGITGGGGGSASLKYLRKFTQEEEKYSVSMSWLDGPVAKNTARGLVSLDHDGGVCIYDTMTAISYHEERFKPTDPGGPEGLRELMVELREEKGISTPGLQGPKTLPLTVEARAAELLVSHAYMPSQHMAVEIDNNDLSDGQIPMVGFRGANTRWSRRMADGAGPKTTKTVIVNPVDFWIASEHLIQIGRLGYRPDKEYPLYEDERGRTVKNYFCAPAHSRGSDSDGHVFTDFLVGLIPDETEREWALDAIAYKAQRPEIPTPAVLLVDEIGGVGKGILFDILIKLMGERNAGLLPQSAVFGGSNMAQYKGDWGARVLHCIEELPSVAEATQKEQHNMYNRLKELVDPRPRTELMPVKYGRPVEVYCCATYWMATNHVDAIPIPDGDRRIVVLTCGEQRERSYYRGVAEWAAKPENIAALYHSLCGRDLAGFDNTYAPETAAKTAMIEITRYGSEVAVREWFERIVDRLGSMPAYITVQMVLDEVRSSDEQAFVSQTGTRRVTSALRRLGYRDPMYTDGRRPMRVRIKHLEVGEGTRETVLQRGDAKDVIGRSTTVKNVKSFVAGLRRKTGGKKVDMADLRRLLITGVPPSSEE